MTDKVPVIFRLRRNYSQKTTNNKTNCGGGEAWTRIYDFAPLSYIKGIQLDPKLDTKMCERQFVDQSRADSEMGPPPETGIENHISASLPTGKCHGNRLLVGQCHMYVYIVCIYIHVYIYIHVEGYHFKVVSYRYCKLCLYLPFTAERLRLAYRWVRSQHLQHLLTAYQYHNARALDQTYFSLPNGMRVEISAAEIGASETSWHSLFWKILVFSAEGESPGDLL